MFRTVNENDFALVYEFYTDDTIKPYMDWEQSSQDDFCEYFQRLASRDEFLLFEENGTAVGILTVTRGKWRTQHVASIGSLAVHASHRGKGVATRMLTLLIDRLRGRGIRRLELLVESDNPVARRLYEKLGFQMEGTLREYFHRVGEPHPIDEYVMSKLL